MRWLIFAVLSYGTPLPPPAQSCPVIAAPVYDPVLGLPPGPTGTRQVFHVNSFAGADDYAKVYWASQAAKLVGGAVILDRIYEIHTWVPIYSNVMYTGGGVRRRCGSDALTPLFYAIESGGYPSGIVIDSMVFDGNWRCGGWTPNWAYNNSLWIRGRNTVRNSIFYDSPAETMVTCGAIVEGNIGYNLGGSFLHKSCQDALRRPDIVAWNRVRYANLLGDAVLEHSEGLITLSNWGGGVFLSNNIFEDGGEGVFGDAGQQEEGLTAAMDCYQNFSHLLNYYDNARTETFRFVGTQMYGVGP